MECKPRNPGKDPTKPLGDQQQDLPLGIAPAPSVPPDPEPSERRRDASPAKDASVLRFRLRHRRPPLAARLQEIPLGADLLLTAEEAAEYLALSPEALARWRTEGSHLPFVKFGHGKGRIRYRLRDLDRFVERSTRRSTSEQPPRSGEEEKDSRRSKTPPTHRGRQ